MSKISQVLPEIWLKSGQIQVPESFLEKISRNMTDTEKTNSIIIIENFVADNIVFGTEVLAHHPEKL